MLFKKEVYVGKEAKYPTIKAALERHKRGHVHILLVSHIADDQDIILPPSLKSLKITSQNEIQRDFLTRGLQIHCQGVKAVFEHIGTRTSNVTIIGAKHNVHEVSITLKQCDVEHVIGGYHVDTIENVYVDIQDCHTVFVTGILNHDLKVHCQTLKMNICHTEMKVLKGIGMEQQDSVENVNIEDGQIFIKDSVIDQINLLNGKREKKIGSIFSLSVEGKSQVGAILSN